MKRQLAFWALVLTALLAVQTAEGQDRLFRQKDLAFAQVAVGGGLETVINLTNRGGSSYSGNLYFRYQNNVIWNPTVNGTPVTMGMLPVTVFPGATVTLRVTGTNIVAGYAVLYANNLNFTSVLEGNLTYYIKSGQTVLDSVGVAPSREVYQTSIPFDNFSTIVLALANLNTSQTATVHCDLFGANGMWSGTRQIFLSPKMHDAKYLTELFGQSGTQAGKVELSCSVPFIGTAGTLVGGELSSLPLEAAPITYNANAIIGPDSFSAQLVIWVEGEIVQGFVTFTHVDGVPVTLPDIEDKTFPLSGRLDALGDMRLGFFGHGSIFDNIDTVAYVLIPDYSFSANSLTADYATFVLGENYAPQGTIQLTKTTD